MTNGWCPLECGEGGRPNRRIGHSLGGRLQKVSAVYGVRMAGTDFNTFRTMLGSSRRGIWRWKEGFFLLV